LRKLSPFCPSPDTGLRVSTISVRPFVPFAPGSPCAPLATILTQFPASKVPMEVWDVVQT
jgi:hypothetical protein